MIVSINRITTIKLLYTIIILSYALLFTLLFILLLVLVVSLFHRIVILLFTLNFWKMIL